MYLVSIKKSYNKWFMSGEKKDRGDEVKTEDKKKCKIIIHMIEEGILTDFDDVDLTDSRYDLKDICRIIDDTKIITVKGMYKQRYV